MSTGNRPTAVGRYTFACKTAPSRIRTSAFCSKSISYCPVMAYRRLSEPGQEAPISLVTADIARWSNGACPHYADDNSKYDLETGEVQHDAHSLKPAYDAHGHDRTGNFGCDIEGGSRAADGFAICRRAGRAAAAAPRVRDPRR